MKIRNPNFEIRNKSKTAILKKQNKSSEKRSAFSKNGSEYVHEFGRLGNQFRLLSDDILGITCIH